MVRKSSMLDTFVRSSDVAIGSNRSFGVTFAVVCSIIALWPMIDDAGVRWPWFAAAALFLIVALVRSAWLAPLNRAWMAFAKILHSIVTPVVMAVLFYLTLTPMALLMRMLGKTPIPVSFDRQADSYWITRRPLGPSPDSMKNQF